ncbi:hypothetical protein D3C71_2002060 [compost metagenome]
MDNLTHGLPRINADDPSGESLLYQPVALPYPVMEGMILQVQAVQLPSFVGMNARKPYMRLYI